MNIQSIGAQQTNKQNVSFGLSKLEITQDEFLQLAREINAEHPILLKPQDFESLTTKLWSAITGVIEKFKDDSKVNVTIGRTYGKFIQATIETPGSKELEFVHTPVLSEVHLENDKRFVKKIDDCVARLKKGNGKRT